MTGDIDHQERFDRIARGLHAEAVQQVPAHILARLRPGPARTPLRRGWSAPLGWSLATACAAVLVLAVGVRTPLAPPSPDAGSAPVVAGASEAPAPLDLYEDPLIAFEEDPELFLWLASDAQPLAME